jgi:hypothetical protein
MVSVLRRKRARGITSEPSNNLLAISLWDHHISGAVALKRRSPSSHMQMKNMHRPSPTAPAQLGFLLDELRAGGLTTYANLAVALNRQGLRPARGRGKPHALYLLMRRHRRAHPQASLNAGPALYARRAQEASRIIRRLQRRGLKTHAMIARALNARGSTTPRFGRPWSGRSVSRVLTAGLAAQRHRSRTAKPTLH